METIFMNTENSKTSQLHRFKLDLTDKRNLKDANKNMALANLSIYYTWKNIKSEHSNKNLALKNNAPFINCISKINGIKIDNAEDLDVVMPMYNLLECSKNYRTTTGSWWNYYRDEPSNLLSSNSKSFK